MTFNFDSTKKDILNKKDKSNVGSVDKPIRSLCDTINDDKDYFTTSSCSGRIVLLIEDEKKRPGLFLFRSHDKVSFDELKSAVVKATSEVKEGIISFKQEPCLVVVSCRDSGKQNLLFSKARNNGWKKSGILSLDKKLLVELMSSENIAFPLIKDGEILVDDNFLKVVLERANGNLERGWRKIERLKGLII